MAPEAYALSAAIDGWILNETRKFRKTENKICPNPLL